MAGLFTLSATGDGGTGTGIASAVPEPRAALVFGVGMVLVGLMLRRSHLPC
jgi:hypothetical protein